MVSIEQNRKPNLLEVPTATRWSTWLYARRNRKWPKRQRSRRRRRFGNIRQVAAPSNCMPSAGHIVSPSDSLYTVAYSQIVTGIIRKA